MSNEIVSGVYQIINTRTKRMYIGMSNNIHKRYSIHLTNLRHSKHSSIKFQYAWDFCNDKKEFELNILEVFDDHLSDCTKRDIETKYINHFASDLFGYNMTDNSTEHIYNRKYDRELYEKHKKINFEIYWNKHCIGEISGSTYGSTLANELIRKASQSFKEIDSLEYYLSKYFSDLMDNLSWITTVNEYNVKGAVKKYVPPLCDNLYKIRELKDSKNNKSTYILKFNYWFDKDSFWNLFNKFKDRGGKYDKDWKGISFSYNPCELPLVDMITKALYPEEEKRQLFLKHYNKIESEYLACS